MAVKQSWIARLVDERRPAGPPIASIDMIAQRRAFFELSELAIEPSPELDLQRDVQLRERDGTRLTAEVARPAEAGPFPVVVYLHGGAWCVWSAAQVRRLTLRLASRGYCVVSLNYGLAPENPFPWGVEDAIYGTRWAARYADGFGGDPTFLAIGGDSSGANLAAATIAFLHGHQAPLDEGDLADVKVTPSAAVLLYGTFDFAQRMHERSTTPGTTEIMSNLAYLGPHFLSKHRDPLVSPFYAPNHDRFPPTYLCCGDQDATLPQSLRMTEALANAGVSTTLSVVSGVDHEFLLMPGHVPVVAQETERLLTWLDERRQDHATATDGASRAASPPHQTTTELDTRRRG